MMPQATIKLKYSFPPSFPFPQILLVYSLLKTIPTNSKSHFFLDPPRQVPVCGVLEEGQSLAVPGVLWCPALEEIAAHYLYWILAGSQQGMEPCARERHSQAAVPAGILEAGKSRLPSANSLTGTRSTDTGKPYFSQQEQQSWHLFPIIRCEIRLFMCLFSRDVLQLLYLHMHSVPHPLIPPHTFHCAMNKQCLKD